MSEYLTKEEIKQWRSSLEKITLEEFAARLGKQIEEAKAKNSKQEKPKIPPFDRRPPINKAIIKSSSPPIRRLYPLALIGSIPLVTFLDTLVPNAKDIIESSITPSPFKEKDSKEPPHKKHTRIPVKPNIEPNTFLVFILSSLNIK